MDDLAALPRYIEGVDPVPDWDTGWKWARSLLWDTNYYAEFFPVPFKRRRYGR